MFAGWTSDFRLGIVNMPYFQVLLTEVMRGQQGVAGVGFQIDSPLTKRRDEQVHQECKCQNDCDLQPSSSKNLCIVAVVGAATIVTFTRLSSLPLLLIVVTTTVLAPSDMCRHLPMHSCAIRQQHPVCRRGDMFDALRHWVLGFGGPGA